MTPYSVGQRVVTDFSGRPTVHKVVEVKTGCKSQTGTMYRLEPPHHRQYSPAWLDHAWLVAV